MLCGLWVAVCCVEWCGFHGWVCPNAANVDDWSKFMCKYVVGLSQGAKNDMWCCVVMAKTRGGGAGDVGLDVDLLTVGMSGRCCSWVWACRVALL